MQVVAVVVDPVVTPFRRRRHLPYSHQALPFRAQDDDPVVAPAAGRTRPLPAPLGPCATQSGEIKASCRHPVSV